MLTRVEIGPYRDRAGLIIHFDPDSVSQEAKDKLEAILAPIAEEMAAKLGMAVQAAWELLLIEAVVRLNDQVAYEREADRRGVLPL